MWGKEIEGIGAVNPLFTWFWQQALWLSWGM